MNALENITGKGSPINILYDRLPEAVEVNGRRSAINSDFKTILLIFELMGDGSIPVALKEMKAVSLFYKEPQSDFATARACMVDFIAKGERAEENAEPVISFSQDADLIFSAFYGQYGIDLNAVNMHWYKFVSLMRGLREDERISETVSIRAMKIPKGMDKETASKYRDLKRRLAIKKGCELSDGDIAANFG